MGCLGGGESVEERPVAIAFSLLVPFSIVVVGLVTPPSATLSVGAIPLACSGLDSVGVSCCKGLLEFDKRVQRFERAVIHNEGGEIYSPTR